MIDSGYGILWTQVILAAALTRSARSVAGRKAEPEEPIFAYADTHGGGGTLARPAAIAAVEAVADQLNGTAFLDAVSRPTRDGGHPGSWVLAARVIEAAGLALESDVNDHDPLVIEAAKANRESGWTRFWSHDWFLFLRERLNRPERPDFVFIDPPSDDPRGPGYAIDAAILLDTFGIPYMVSYPVDSPQAPIDQIGRSGLELHRDGQGWGVLLGGGAEAVVLDVLADLRLVATALGGSFNVRLPHAPVDDYCI